MESGAYEASQAGNFIGLVFRNTLILFIVYAVLGEIKRYLQRNKEKGENSKDSIETKKKNSLKKFIVIGVVLLLAIFIAIYQVSSPNSDTSTQQNTDSKGWSNTVKNDFKKGLLGSCKEGETKYCTCIADYLIKNYTPDEVYKIYEEAKKTNSTPNAVNDGARACTLTLNVGSQ